MTAGDRPEAAYEGEIDGERYTVQVLPAGDRAARKGKRHVLLRIRYRGKMEDFVEEVPRAFTELYVRTVVRRLIADYSPS